MNKIYEEVFRNGLGYFEVANKKGHAPHNEGAPAILIYDPHDGSVATEFWCRDGLRHREDGSAFVEYWPGYFHISDTQSYLEFDDALAVKSVGWYRNGEQIPTPLYPRR